MNRFLSYLLGACVVLMGVFMIYVEYFEEKAEKKRQVDLISRLASDSAEAWTEKEKLEEENRKLFNENLELKKAVAHEDLT